MTEPDREPGTLAVSNSAEKWSEAPSGPAENAGEPGKRASKPGKPNKPGKNRWRPWVRAIHRDVGYFAIGLTVIYALSGLAVNHIDDWDPNFTQVRQEHQLGPLSGSDEAIGQQVADRLKLEEAPAEVFRVSDDELEVAMPSGNTLQVKPATGDVLLQGQKPRFFLRAANWLHLNRGKQAWSYIADGYAIFLLYLALSGLFMIPGKKGLVGRGAVLATLGALVPVLYVVLSGGP